MKTKGKFTLVALALLSAFALPSAAKDGTYQATTMGRNGDVTVQVTIQNDKIADVKILEWSETHPIADLPAVQLPADMVKYQTSNVDIVSGATLTSFAIRNAVRDCVKQAGLDVKAFTKKAPSKPVLITNVKDETDVLIVGGGGAGLSAAVAAAEKGKSVIVVEKAHFLGGDTCVAGGGYNAADRALEMKQEMTEGQRAMVEKFCRETPRNELHSKLIGMVQKQWEEFKAKNEKGLFDSPEYHALQSWAAGDYVAKLDLVYEMCRMSPATLKTLADMGLKWDDYTTQYIGALWPRSHKASNYKSGVGFIDTYINLIKTKNYPVKYIMQTRATDFIVENGRVVGIKAKGDNGANYELRAKNGVVLATGGFSANVDMRQKYDTIWDKKLGENVKTTNVPAITGDGIVMAEKIGANLIDMGLIQLLSNTDPATGATNHKLGQSTCIFVNKDGKRFVNELGRRDVLSKAALAQEGGVFYVITCESTNWVDKDGRNLYGIKVADLLKQKKVFKGDTIEELAKNAGINAANLKATVEAWQAFCKNPKDDPFGRASCEADTALPAGPYYATIMTPSVHHTMGGVEINTKTQVLDTKGNVIPGLFAAGEVTGGIHGSNRVGANAIPDALNFGRLAGQMAADYQAK